METVLINVEKKSDIAFLVSLAKKLGMFAKPLTQNEVEDWKLEIGSKDRSGNENTKC